MMKTEVMGCTPDDTIIEEEFSHVYKTDENFPVLYRGLGNIFGKYRHGRFHIPKQETCGSVMAWLY
jgi:hypothetical protein